MVGPPPETEVARARRQEREGVPAAMRKKIVTLTGGKRRDKIRNLLGTNFVSLIQKGGKLELATVDDIPPGLLIRIQRIWEHEEA